MNFLFSIGQWLLRIFLGGLFNKVMTQIEDRAEHTKQAAVAHAESAEDAAKVEIAVVKKQAEVDKAYKDPAPTDDPFRTVAWNERKTE